MTKMITIPENYDNIRAVVVELLKTARSTFAQNGNSIMTACTRKLDQGSFSPSKMERSEPSMETASARRPF
jgi:hypothetical protein